MPYSKEYPGLWIEPWYKAWPPFSWLFGGCEDAWSNLCWRFWVAGRLIRHPVSETKYRAGLARTGR